MTRADKLRSLQDPTYANHVALTEVLSHVEKLRGEPGYSPQLGIDYLRPEEMTPPLRF